MTPAPAVAEQVGLIQAPGDDGGDAEDDRGRDHDDRTGDVAVRLARPCAVVPMLAKLTKTAAATGTGREEWNVDEMHAVSAFHAAMRDMDRASTYSRS